MAERLSPKLTAALTDQFGKLPEFEDDTKRHSNGYTRIQVDQYTPSEGYVRFIEQYGPERYDTSEYIVIDKSTQTLARRKLHVDAEHFHGITNAKISYLDGRFRKSFTTGLGLYESAVDNLSIALSYHNDPRSLEEDRMRGQEFAVVDYGAWADGQEFIKMRLPFPFNFTDQMKFGMQHPGWVKTTPDKNKHFTFSKEGDILAISYPDPVEYINGEYIKLDKQCSPALMAPTGITVRETPRLLVCEFENPSLDYSVPLSIDYKALESLYRTQGREWTTINDIFPARLTSPQPGLLPPMGKFT